MSYRNAGQVLPKELVDLIQTYTDGEYIYIPRKEENRHSWGSKTRVRKELDQRNALIYQDYQDGNSCMQLAEKYYLSIKSIQRIVLAGKQKSR